MLDGWCYLFDVLVPSVTPFELNRTDSAYNMVRVSRVSITNVDLVFKMLLEVYKIQVAEFAILVVCSMNLVAPHVLLTGESEIASRRGARNLVCIHDYSRSWLFCR
jgi:hypothetical protein